jgi:hypothetical protein
MSMQSVRAGVLGVLTVAAALGGCSNAALGPESDAEGVSSTGTLELPLTATSAGVKYRLAQAKFVIKGTSLNFSRTITPPPNTPVDQETLPAGQFQIALQKGWELQAKGPADSDFKAVDAKLTSPNPASFEIKRGKTIDVVFTFVSSYGSIALDTGKANVRISVQDCASFDTLSASLATFTVECLGRIDQYSYKLSDDGYLERNFDECPLDESMLQNIDDFLGVQYPRAALAGRATQLDVAKDCIGGRWAQWKEAFDASGITECPDWKFVEELNTPTPDLYDKYAAALPTLPFQETGARPSILSQLKINTVYSVNFADGNTDQRCQTPGDCAQQCAAGFPGFVIRNDGETVLTDPDPWEKDNNYNGGPNPYTRGAYYHPMSLTGEIPGEIVGHWQRSQSTPKQELCSYYDYTSGLHIQTTLIPDCQAIDSTGTQSCISLCLPPLIR